LPLFYVKLSPHKVSRRLSAHPMEAKRDLGIVADVEY
jgi:hypothetical protein